MFKPTLLLAFPMTLLAACATSAPTSTLMARGDLIRTDGTQAGMAELLRTGERLAVRIIAAGFEPGTRALHLHQLGKCEAPTFTSAGSHLNPYGRTHGQLSETGKHLGDLPNLEIPQSGAIQATFEVDGAAAEVLAHIFDADGTAVMIHAGPDDYRTDPTGSAGARIACATLTRAN